MMTKQQEREALERIKNILADAGADSYIGMALRALGLALGMGGDLRPSGLLISKMHKDSIRNAA